jgi:hypothetical protein
LLAIILLFVAVLSVAMLHSVHAETQPTIRLTSIDHPQTVLAGTAFHVKINADYSGSFLSDVGVWDVNSSLMVQSETLISQFTGPGNVSFSLSLTAPKMLGPWHLLAINRVWWQNAWYQDPEGGELPFAVNVSNNVTLTLGSSGAAAQISVDGFPYEVPNASTVSPSLNAGAHVLVAPAIIQQGVGQRYVFVGWSDGVNSNLHSIFLTGSTTIYALYRTEFYLSTQSDIGQTVGDGWYPNGTEATVAAPVTAVTGQFGYVNVYRFTEWSGASDSASNTVVLTMDGPKQIKANWVNVGPIIDSNFLAVVLLACCLPLLGRLAFICLRRRGRLSLTGYAKAEKRHGLLILVLVILVLSLISPAAHAQALPQPNASVVRIGDADWYYWSHSGSDTCLIWLGGGVPEQTEPGSYAYFINPFDYESFDTIGFIQDLANYYCVIALQQGPVQGFNPAANRTINQELVQPGSTIIEEVHAWIVGQGYAHTFVVGYSVGGQAAIADLTLAHPEDWTAEDGIILITVPFSQDVVNNARELRANLFIIYGGNLPDYEATGIQFYNNTHPEGSNVSGYFHKEFHVINDAGHEVWTIRATGAYDRRALYLMIRFIEQSKTLQITHGLAFSFSNSTSEVTAGVTSVQAPLKVNVGEAFLVRSEVNYQVLTSNSTILVAYAPGYGGLLSEASLTETPIVASIIIPPICQGMKLVLSFAVFRDFDGRWVQASDAYSTIIAITDQTTLTIQTSIPGASFSFDGTQYATNSSGLVEIQTVAGQHLVQVQPFIYLTNFSRLRFVGWEDSANDTSRQISLYKDERIEISYVQQYLIQANSMYGETSGSGWYDANSTVAALVQPPILNSPPVMFLRWTAYGNQSQTRILFQVTSPQVISALWKTQNLASLPGQTPFDPVLILSVLAFIFLVILNVIFRTPTKVLDVQTKNPE